MNCSLCGKKIETTFLNKIVGTIVKHKGKKYFICNECQKRFSSENFKEEVLKELGISI